MRAHDIARALAADNADYDLSRPVWRQAVATLINALGETEEAPIEDVLDVQIPRCLRRSVREEGSGGRRALHRRRRARRRSLHSAWTEAPARPRRVAHQAVRQLAVESAGGRVQSLGILSVRGQGQPNAFRE